VVPQLAQHQATSLNGSTSRVRIFRFEHAIVPNAYRETTAPRARSSVRKTAHTSGMNKMRIVETHASCLSADGNPTMAKLGAKSP